MTKGTDDRHPVHSDSIDSFTLGYVRKQARQLVGKHGFRESDREEIEQRLFLKLAKRLHSADPDDPKWKAYVATTVQHRIASMIRDNRAEKRDHRRSSSIHVSIDTDEGSVELAHLLGEHEAPSRRSSVQRSDQQLKELMLDINECLADFTDPTQREFFERLKHASISQVARDMDIPRTTLNAWLGKLRCRFEELGLKEYFESGSSVRRSTGFLTK